MRFLKIFIGSLIVLLILSVIGVFWGKTWINNNLESVVNANPDRKYNFKFERVEIDLLKRVILINEVKIIPIAEVEGVFVEGYVVQVLLSQVDILKLILRRNLEIQELSFSRPEFVIHIPLENSKKEKPTMALQSLFGDILSRGQIRNFQLGNANALVLLGEDEIGRVSNLNILANELSTDSLKWNYPIPFDYERILISLESIDYLMGNDQRFKSGKIVFDTQSQQLKINTLSLKYPNGLRKASGQTDLQGDLIEFSLDSLILSGIEANSNLYSDFDVRARKIELAGLLFEDFRNKDLPRPPNEVKTLFQGLVKKINFPLKLDTLKVTDGSIVYGESVPGKNQFWQFHLSDLNGDLYNITSIPEHQAILKSFGGSFTGRVDGLGQMNIDLKVPYSIDEFDLEIDFTNFPLTRLNQLLNPIMNGEIVTGDLARLSLKIHADSLRSSNQLRFDYTNLKVELFQKDSQKKNKVMSTLANIALNSSNMPTDTKYLTSSYSTQRNQFRGPFHLIWKSTKEGIMNIVPGGAAKEVLKTSEK